MEKWLVSFLGVHLKKPAEPKILKPSKHRQTKQSTISYSKSRGSAFCLSEHLPSLLFGLLFGDVFSGRGVLIKFELSQLNHYTQDSRTIFATAVEDVNFSGFQCVCNPDCHLILRQLMLFQMLGVKNERKFGGNTKIEVRNFPGQFFKEGVHQPLNRTLGGNNSFLG